jgi:tetratricopeptide (TPR) repeat protein
MGDISGSIVVNDYTISTFKQSQDAEVRGHVAWAMVNKGWDLATLGQFDEAITVYENLSEMVPFEPPFLHPVAQGLMNKALTVKSAGRHVEEVPIYDRIARGLESATAEPEVRLHAWARINKAITLIGTHNYDEAIELCDSVLSRWWALSDWTTTTRVREFLAAATRHRADAMAAKGEYQDAIARIDKLLRRYLRSNESGLTMEVAWAMVTKADALWYLGHRKDAKYAYDAAVARFSRSRDKQVQEAVAWAHRESERLDRVRST